MEYALVVYYIYFYQKIKSLNKFTPKKTYISTTYVYNLSADEMHIKDISFDVKLTYHHDGNEDRFGQKWDKAYDVWKFFITITDNQTKSRSSLDASFFIYEESSELIQYHCNVESVDIKAIIFDKTKSTWEILLLQNDAYKILSSYPGYHFINAFDIKSKSKSNIDY